MARTVRYTDYASRRLSRRNISLQLASTVLDGPEQLIDERGRKIAQTRWMTPSGKQHLLRVVYEEQGDEIVIITVYDTSRVQKYWRTS